MKESLYNRLDESSGCSVSIDHLSHDVHEGNHFYVENYVELDSGDSLYVKLVTPDTSKRMHFSWEIDSSGILTTTLDEDATGGMTGGSAVSILNNDRNSSNTSEVVLTSGVTAPTGYTTRVANQKMGGDGYRRTYVGGSSGSAGEMILKNDTTYCRTFTSGSDGNILFFRASWGEETPENA